MSSAPKLTKENYSQGFLLDDELMGGISESSDSPGTFVAFVLRHTTGEYLGHQSCADIEEALYLLNRIPRQWAFESTSECGTGKCGGCNKNGTSRCTRTLDKVSCQ